MMQLKDDKIENIPTSIFKMKYFFCEFISFYRKTVFSDIEYFSGVLKCCVLLGDCM